MRFINITGEEIVYFKTDGTKEIFPSIGKKFSRLLKNIVQKRTTIS